MAIPKPTRAEPKKKKTPWEKLKNSALFILLMVIVFTLLMVYLIVLISGLLSSNKLPWPFG